MSIAGIASSLFSQVSNLQNKKPTTLQQEFQQLATDLQSGNLSAAQTDFAALQQNAPASQAGGQTLSQAVSALGNDLQSGNLAGAQKDFAAIQQDIQQASQQGGQVHHHHHHAEESQGSSASSAQQITQLFNTLGQDLQSGNLSSAQQAYSSLQQDMQLLPPAARA
jgi:outer membrane protein assembly factor BamD (BamD/ComL family)